MKINTLSPFIYLTIHFFLLFIGLSFQVLTWPLEAIRLWQICFLKKLSFIESTREGQSSYLYRQRNGEIRRIFVIFHQLYRRIPNRKHFDLVWKQKIYYNFIIKTTVTFWHTITAWKCAFILSFRFAVSQNLRFLSLPVIDLMFYKNGRSINWQMWDINSKRNWVYCDGLVRTQAAFIFSQDIAQPYTDLSKQMP